MRNLFLFATLLFVSTLPSAAQTCTGLCLQQTTCSAGTTTTLTGTVYAPNGTDPLPNVTVYIPNAPVDAFSPGVACPVVGQPPSGSPLVGAMTAVDGTFTLTNVPVGTDIPLVIQTGRWRRQVLIPTVTACTSTAITADLTRMPRTQAEGDIPKFAIATGAVDAVECVLRKVGIADSEFTVPGGGGRIALFQGTKAPGSVIDATNPALTPSQETLMSDLTNLGQYDVLMLPCQGTPSGQTNPNNDPKNQDLANIIAFANAGGRIYASHYSYTWMYQNPPFSSVVNWHVNQPSPRPDPNLATIDQTFSQGATLADWLPLVGASTTPGKIQVGTLRHDFDGVNPPTQKWLTLDDPADKNPVMQFVFDTPVGAIGKQCGKVLFDEYHVENPTMRNVGVSFPAECSAAAMTPQEKLLEFSLFDLTNDGGVPTLTPTAADFGQQPLGFPSGQQTFFWKNNSIFGSSVTSATATGDYIVSTNTCGSVASGATCQIGVVFSPTALGTRTGALTVVSTGNTLTATLTGVGIPGLDIGPASLDFGSADIGASVSRTLAVTNSAPGPIPLPALVTTPDFAASSNCGTAVPAQSRCTITVVFTPSASGPRTGTLTLQSRYANSTFALTGNGLDFSIAVAPASGQVIAGYGIATTVTVSPIAGFESPVTLSCTTNAPGSACILKSPTITPSLPTSVAVNITTTSQYTVIGYGGFGATPLLSILALISTLLLWSRRKTLSTLPRALLLALLLSVISLSATGCSGKLPAQNPNFTAPGSYTYTLSATDGTITHSTTYTLNVTTK